MFFETEKRINRLQKAVEREETQEQLRRQMLVKRRSNVRQPSWCPAVQRQHHQQQQQQNHSIRTK